MDGTRLITPPAKPTGGVVFSPLANDELSIFDGKASMTTASALFWPILLRTFDVT
jgi:hypothetical protein